MKKTVSILLSIGIITASVLISVTLILHTKRSELPIDAMPVGLSAAISDETTTEAGSSEPEATSAVIETTREETGIAGKYDHDAYQQQIQAIAQKYGAVGVSAALIENGNVIDTFACGSAVKDGLAMTADTKLRIASISKVFVGIAAMISVENGTMSLDEDIGTYWGFSIGTHADGDVVTPRTLLTHTSSVLPSDVSDDMYYNAMADRLRTGSGIGDWQSGTLRNYHYNNYAMDVMGVTIELANGRTLDDILRERIYSKLDIDAAFYAGDLKDTAQIADLYYADGTEALAASRMRTWHSGKPGAKGWGFAGGVTINVKDLGKIVALLAERGVLGGVRYLSEESIQNLEYHEGNNIGKYWQCQPLRYEKNKYNQGEFYYHTGSAYGVLSLAGYNPVTGRGVAVLTTGASRNVANADIFDAVAELLLHIEA